MRNVKGVIMIKLNICKIMICFPSLSDDLSFKQWYNNLKITVAISV